jgi:hypothetical protein
MSAIDPKDQGEEGSLPTRIHEQATPGASEVVKSKPNRVGPIYELILQIPRDSEKELVSQEEVDALETLPFADYVPTHPHLRKSFFGHLGISESRTLRQNFQVLQEILRNPRQLGKAFAGMSNNVYSAIGTNLEFLKEELQIEDGTKVFQLDPSKLSEYHREAYDDILASLGSWADLLGILSRSQDGAFLRTFYLGRRMRFNPGMARVYKDFWEKVYPALPSEMRENLGLVSLLNHQQIIMKIWKLTRQGPNP